MVKWKLFHRSREKVQTETQRITNHTNKTVEHTSTIQTTKDSKPLPIKEYTDTLYSKDSVLKQPTIIQEKRPLMKRTSWENAEVIEHYVDTIGPRKNRAAEPTGETGDEIEKKVDFILLKKKKQL